MSDGDPRITLLEQRLADAKMPEAEASALADDLAFAVAINGDQAPVMQGLKRMLISGVRRELAAIDRTERHFAACPVASRIKKDDKGELIMPWEQSRAGDTEFSLSWKDGLRAKGKVAWAAAGLTVISAVIYAVTAWQRSEMLDEVKSLIQAQQPALEQHATI